MLSAKYLNKEMNISMTNKELSKLYHLKKEIEIQRNRLCELENIASSCTAKITGMPHSKEISDKVGKYATQIADLKYLLDLNLKNAFLNLID